MKKDEPHSIVDDEAEGHQTKQLTTTTRPRRKKLIVSIEFENIQQEFDLWDFAYDLRHDQNADFVFETDPDYKNRIQHYQIIGERKVINKFRLWLMKNDFTYKLDKE